MSYFQKREKIFGAVCSYQTCAKCMKSLTAGYVEKPRFNAFCFVLFKIDKCCHKTLPYSIRAF